ncbi:MAG: hypothetical protein IKH65_11305 [Clostridia bacterium]|nr:hypothetical protein [Clostridia bacterium]
MITEKLFRRYARPCSFSDGRGNTLGEMSAFISPLRYRNKMYIYGVNTAIGYNSEGYYLYIGPASADITGDGISVHCGDDTYLIDRAEKVYYGSDVFYIWAVLRKTVEVN